MDDPLAASDGVPSGSKVGGESNVNALLVRGTGADSGCAGLLGGAEKLARRSKENVPTVGAAAEGAGAIGAAVEGASPLFPAAPNRFASQVAGTAQRAGTSSCSTTDWPVELDGGPGGSDVAGALRRCMDRLAGSESGSDAELSDWVTTLICTWWEIICRSKLARSREMRKLARSRDVRR